MADHKEMKDAVVRAILFSSENSRELLELDWVQLLVQEYQLEELLVKSKD